MKIQSVFARHAGWALLESLLVVGVAALMVLGVARIVSELDQTQSVDRAAMDLRRMEHSLLGYALVNHKFPLPQDMDEATPASGVLVEGWLPLELTANLPAGAFQYTVDPTLVVAPIVSYQIDPLDMTKGSIARRTSPGGVDFCMQLIKHVKERRGDREVVAFGLHDARGRPASMPQGATKTKISWEYTGHSELLNNLGCFRAMGNMSNGLRSVVQSADRWAMARQITEYYDMRIWHLQQSSINHAWRTVGLGLTMAAASNNLLLATLNQYTTPMSGILMAPKVVSSILTISSMSLLLKLTLEFKAKVDKAIPEAKVHLESAQVYEALTKAQLAQAVNHADAAAEKGLIP
jgi:hypothetical protein